MAYVLADNIISPLGDTSEENYLSAKAGKSGIRTYSTGTLGIPEGFTASIMQADFEELAFLSAKKALLASHIDVSQKNVVFILSSTKGAIERNIGLAESAHKISQHLGFTTKPIVVCNACISGLSALTLGSRLIEMRTYDYAVVCGCDTPAQFIISGFQSLKALSSEACRPFDMERFGLNLGEAAATIVLGKEQTPWQLHQGFIKNDAFHISAPSKTADGLYEALTSTLSSFDKEQVAFINAHGTATLFNDQMESIAIKRADLSDTPTNALKGYFGHTLGAAGILETILCMKSIDDHNILGTRGFEELGVSGKVNISAENRPTDKLSFVKMLSGFGGCNAAMLATKVLPSSNTRKGAEAIEKSDVFQKCHEVKITPQGVAIDGKELANKKNEPDDNQERTILTALYKQHIGNYPKYYKMDGLSRLGFIASELLLQTEKDSSNEKNEEDRAVILFNHSSSIASDKKYMESIADKSNYFPSPSVFVYTLPNIVTGEIAIRNGYHGETSFYILSNKDEQQMTDILKASFLDPQTNSAISGWIDYEDEHHFEAELYLAKRK